MDATRRHLSNVLDRDLMLYERYVPNPEMLAEYLEGTKDGLVELVTEVFDTKIQELRRGSELGRRSSRSSSRPTLPLKSDPWALSVDQPILTRSLFCQPPGIGGMGEGNTRKEAPPNVRDAIEGWLEAARDMDRRIQQPEWRDEANASIVVLNPRSSRANLGAAPLILRDGKCGEQKCL